MNIRLLSEGVLLGINESGGKIEEIDDKCIYISVTPGSLLDNDFAQQRLSELIEQLAHLTVKVK